MRTKQDVPSTSDLNGSTVSWTTTRTSLMEIRNPTSKSAEPRAYQNVEMTKRKKVEKKSLNIKAKVEATMMETTPIEEALSS